MRSSRPKPAPLYAHPRLYDLAFGHRDIPAECDGLLAIARAHGLERPQRVVELACGPAHHLRELARRGLAAYGIDLSPQMLSYARKLCKREQVAVELQLGDMRSFRLPAKVDLALCLFDSFVYCTTDADAVAALQSVARVLRGGGMLLLELAHPADFFNLPGPKRTLSQWTDRRARTTIRTRFTVTHVDPVNETYVARINILASTAARGLARRIVERRVHRMWLRSGVTSIAAQSGAFDLVGAYGALNPGVPLTMSAEAWRMVIALRRRGAARR